MATDSDAPDALRYDRSAGLTGTDSLSLIAGLIPRGAAVLDLGTSTGKLGQHLREQKGCVADGVEVDGQAAELARPHYRTLLQLDLETARLAEHFPRAAYRAIVCADVLEHLRNPGRLLEEIAPLLAPGGRLLVSIPNVGYAGVVAGLLNGNFPYHPTGILDTTHVRFFTRGSLLELLAAHGFAARSVQTVQMLPGQTEFPAATFEALPPAARDAVLDAPDALVYQFIVEAAPEPAVVSRRPQPAPTTAAVQAFWCGSGETYDPRRSVTAGLVMGRARAEARLRLPPDVGAASRLRLDLGDNPGFLRVHDVAVVDAQGKPVWVWNGDPRSFASRHDLAAFIRPPDSIWLATSYDPFLEIELSPEAGTRLDGATIVIGLSWPLSADHALAIEAITEASDRWAQRHQAQAVRLAALERTAPLLEERVSLLRRELEALQATVADRLEAMQRSERAARETAAAESRAALERQEAESRLLARRVAELESARGARATWRRVRSAVLRPSIHFEPHPLRDLSGSAPDFESTGLDPSFDLQPRGGRFPRGWVRLSFALEAGPQSGAPPCLYVDAGAGYREDERLVLPLARAGFIRTVVELPSGIRALRFDPLAAPGRFRLGELRAQEIGAREARLRLTRSAY